MAQVGLLEIVIVIFSFLSLCALHWKRNKNTAITQWPVLGMLPAAIRHGANMFDYVTHVLNRCGGTFVFKGPWLLDLDFIITSDFKNLNHILIENSSNYMKGPRFRECLDSLGDGIIGSDFDNWRHQRMTVLPIIKQAKFLKLVENTIENKIEKGLFPIMEHAAKKGIEIDLHDVFRRFSFDKICSLVLGTEINYLSVDFPEATYLNALQDIEDAVYQRCNSPKIWWKPKRLFQIGLEKRLTEGLKCLDSLTYNCISSHWEMLKAARNDGHQDGVGSLNLMTAMLEEIALGKGEKREDAYNESRKLMRDAALTLIAAGASSVSASLSWFFYLIASNPSVETKILEEMKAVISEDAKFGELRIFSDETLNKLPYLHGAVSETLRLYSAVPVNPRSAVESDILPSGHYVGKNMRILLFLYSVGRMEELWGKDCSEFKPERWISEHGKVLHIPAQKFGTFGNGPRFCLGKQMALIEFKKVAAAILWNYHVDVVQGHQVLPRRSVVLYMKQGLKVQIRRR